MPSEFCKQSKIIAGKKKKYDPTQPKLTYNFNSIAGYWEVSAAIINGLM